MHYLNLGGLLRGRNVVGEKNSEYGEVIRGYVNVW